MDDFRAKEIISYIENDQVERLIRAVTTGADPDLCCKKGYPLLVWAICRKNSEMVEFLISAGADTNFKCHDGATPLIWAACYLGEQDITALLKAKAEIDGSDGKGKTALISAVERNKHEVVQVLLDAGADVFASDVNGERALNHAQKHADKAMIDLIQYVEDKIKNPEIKKAIRQNNGRNISLRRR